LGTAGIVAFPFGSPKTIQSNRRIAEIASRKAHELSALVYTLPDVQIESGIQVEYTKEKPDKTLTTLGFARRSVQWAKRHRFTELWIVAAKPHLWRALRDVQRAVREGRAQIKVHVCNEVEQCSEDSWFCPDSIQKRARSRKVWNKRERILKITPFFIYKLVAS
jgi:hypothetical protein